MFRSTECHVSCHLLDSKKVYSMLQRSLKLQVKFNSGSGGIFKHIVTTVQN